MTRRRKWTPERLTEVLQMREAGVPAGALAARFGVTPEQMSRITRLAREQRGQHEDARPSPPARRTCLGPLCLGRQTFRSTGPGNRLCSSCREAVERLGEEMV